MNAGARRMALALLAWARLALATAPASAFQPAALAETAGTALERLDRALFVASRDGTHRVDLSGLFDLEGYYVDQRPPGLIFGGDSSFANPRLSLFLDARAGRHVYGFVQARADRGFDPRLQPGGAFRFDEYLLRYTPFDDDRLTAQVGKFATVVGNWVPRHLSWDNPFITAPLPYENVTIVADNAAPASADDFLARRNLADEKTIWLPVIWGPSYTSGASLVGRLGDFDLAVEVKNASLSSRPPVWDARNRGWGEPTVSGRFGWRPSPAWTLGVSASGGAFLRDKAEASLPPGESLGDARQELVGLDAGFAWRHVQIWSELFMSRFEVPAVGDADTLAWYVESRYKLTPALWAGLRWNQQWFGTVTDGAGEHVPWDRDIWRLDAVLGWRFDRHLQVKLQYAINHQRGGVQQGEQLVAAQATLKF